MISTKSEFLVEMQGITKRFPGVLALDKVDFQLKPGEVHVLLGENGAGKSTLIKVLSGAHLADEGRIQIEGQAVDISSPHSMLEKGLRFIYQELNLPATNFAGEALDLNRKDGTFMNHQGVFFANALQ